MNRLTADRAGGSGCYNAPMIRIREIFDLDLKLQILEKLAERRGTSVAAIPEWFELDDADYVDLLNDLKGDTDNEMDAQDDYRM